MKAYKFLLFREGKIVSDYNWHKWKIGKWYSVRGEVAVCDNGFHASRKPLDALSYVTGNVLAIVEYRGDFDERDDKLASREMRIVRAYHWTKKDDVAMQAYCASLVLHIFENARPDDTRVRDCINVMRQYARGEATNEELGVAKDTAWDASNTVARLPTRGAVWAVTRKSARGAVEEAVGSSTSAAWNDTAWMAVRNATQKKINRWMVRRLNKLGRIE